MSSADAQNSNDLPGCYHRYRPLVVACEYSGPFLGVAVPNVSREHKFIVSRIAEHDRMADHKPETDEAQENEIISRLATKALGKVYEAEIILGRSTSWFDA